MGADHVKRVLLVPAYNESSRIGPVLDRVREKLPDYTIVVVDDGSADDTERVARAHGARVLRHPFNMGYGAALQTGYKFAVRSGVDLLVQMDADGQHDPEEAAALAAPVLAGELDLVIGSRFLGVGDYQMDPLRRTGRKLFQQIVRAFGLRVTDPTSGFQALSRSVLELYVSDIFPSDFPDVDVLLVAHRHGLRVGERPVHMAESPRTSTLHAGLAPIYYVYKMLLSIWAASTRRKATRPGGPQ
jgi:glycosyltransferase involved in cell wall biosynthesis